MIGTIANAGTILLGSVVGSALKKGIGEKYQSIMMDSMGLAATALGINSIVGAMPQSKYHVLFIVSLALGGLIGTRLSLDTAFDRLVSRFSKGSNLAKGLSTAILLYCAGTLSILGPIESALNGDHTYLFTNAILDGITSVVLSSTFGLRIAIAAGVLFCWQGSIYLLANLTYKAPLDDADPEAYPFVFTSGSRIPNAIHSRLHNVPNNRSLRPKPTADMNEADCRRLGVKEGDRIVISTARGSITVCVHPTLSVPEGLVNLFHGYSEADANLLTDSDHLDPYSGFPAYRSIRCTVRKEG